MLITADDSLQMCLFFLFLCGEGTWYTQDAPAAPAALRRAASRRSPLTEALRRMQPLS